MGMDNAKHVNYFDQTQSCDWAENRGPSKRMGQLQFALFNQRDQL